MASTKMRQVNLLAWGDKLGELTACTSFHFTENQTCHSPLFRSQKVQKWDREKEQLVMGKCLQILL